MSAMHWEPGRFSANCAHGRHDTVAWISGHFALDFRPTVDDDFEEPSQIWACWMLSHVPTGMAIMGIRDSLNVAKVMAEQFAALPIDWASLDHETAEPFRDLAQEIKDGFGDRAVRGAETIGQWVFG